MVFIQYINEKSCSFFIRRQEKVQEVTPSSVWCCVPLIINLLEKWLLRKMVGVKFVNLATFLNLNPNRDGSPFKDEDIFEFCGPTSEWNARLIWLREWCPVSPLFAQTIL